ncbi:MAG TPA: low temperature requirement protein A, partial [Candidatus Limnocylindrales bacterium]|nr:low temperature requirement protein A [Candidatus Limnocylindrales bacterium]
MPAGRRRFAAPLGPRDRHEAHRAATPLEIFFDLVAVIAIAAAAAGLHHALAEGHAVDGTIGFVFGFFAIWWAWMNYTWFASAFDNGDTLFRLLTLVIMTGALILATGIPAFFEGGTLYLGLTGYMVMRFGMVTLWLRVAADAPDHRRTALRFAAGITAVQGYWLLMILGTSNWGTAFKLLFVLGMALEFAVPLWAERAMNTPWHRHHIMERYGLLTIIVLGETLLSSVIATRGAIEHTSLTLDLAMVALSALVTAFALWWLYFSDEEHLASDDTNRAFVWGYGHMLIFGAGAAVGAGFAAQIDVLTEQAHLSTLNADLAVAIPVAIYFFGLWLVRDRYCLTGPARWVLVVGALLALATPILPRSLACLAVLAV